MDSLRNRLTLRKAYEGLNRMMGNYQVRLLEGRAVATPPRLFGERKFLERSWAADFARHIFPFINERRFEPLYCNDNGRPNTPINVQVGACIIKEIFGFSDDEMLEFMLFDVQIQYALQLTSEREIPFSDRTLSRLRAMLAAHEEETGHDLMKEEVLALALRAKELLGVDDKVRRMDSMMISSRCKKIGRLELVYTCVENLVKEYVDTEGPTNLPEQLVKYTDPGNKNATIYRARGIEVEQRLNAAVADAFAIKALCCEAYAGSAAYSLLSRMLDDQTDDGNPKDGKNVRSTSLQNPSDPDATFCRKGGAKHTGY